MNEERKTKEENEDFVQLNVDELLEKQSSDDDDSGDESRIRNVISGKTTEELLEKLAKRGSVISYKTFVLTTPTIRGSWDLNAIIFSEKNKDYRITNLGWNMPLEYALKKIADHYLQDQNEIYVLKKYIEQYTQVKNSLNILREDNK